MTSKEFVAFMKGIAIGIEDTPTPRTMGCCNEESNENR